MSDKIPYSSSGRHHSSSHSHGTSSKRHHSSSNSHRTSSRRRHSSSSSRSSSLNHRPSSSMVRHHLPKSRSFSLKKFFSSVFHRRNAKEQDRITPLKRPFHQVFPLIPRILYIRFGITGISFVSGKSLKEVAKITPGGVTLRNKIPYTNLRVSKRFSFRQLGSWFGWEKQEKE